VDKSDFVGRETVELTGGVASRRNAQTRRKPVRANGPAPLPGQRHASASSSSFAGLAGEGRPAELDQVELRWMQRFVTQLAASASTQRRSQPAQRQRPL